jgi:hypothetical protein
VAVGIERTTSTTSGCSRDASAEGGYSASTCESTVGGVTAAGPAWAHEEEEAATEVKVSRAAVRDRRWPMEDAAVLAAYVVDRTIDEVRQP